MESFQKESHIRGYDVYNEQWKAIVGASWKSAALLQQQHADRRTFQSQHEEWHCIMCKNHAYMKPWFSALPNSL